MNPRMLRSLLPALCLLITIGLAGLLSTSATSAQAPAQAELTIGFEFEYFPSTTNNQETSVEFDDTIIVSNSEAEVECDPPSGSLFPRGATLVTCTATLGEQTATGSFYVLVVSNAGEDTDIEMYTIAQIPGEIVEASNFTYNVELRNNGNRRATGVIVSGRLPQQVDLVRAGNNCDTSKLPMISCVIPELLPGAPRAFALDVKVKPGFTGAMFLTMSAEITGEGEDIFATNDSFTRRTDVLQLGFAGNVVYLPMLRR